MAMWPLFNNIFLILVVPFVSFSSTSSKTMLTKSSNPTRVPENSLSFVINTVILLPTALSMTSNGNIVLISSAMVCWFGLGTKIFTSHLLNRCNTRSVRGANFALSW